MYIDLVTINLCPGQGGGGVKPSGSLEISENGVYDVYSYASASVDVHPSASLSETYISNGSYNITGEFNGGVITVDVPAPQFVTETLNVSANGTYNPGEGIDGYSQVVVDVPQSVTGFTEKELTEGVQIVNLSNTASFVASNAFMGNATIQTVNLPYATSIGISAFNNCKSLSYVSLSICTSIGSNAFYSCTSLSQVSLPVCDYVGYNTFAGCRSLSQVSLPVCTYVANNAFYNCTSLSYVSLPLCGNIDKYAFSNCRSLNSLTLCTDVYWTIPYQSRMLSNTPIMSGTGSIYVRSDTYSIWITSTGWSSLSDRFVSVETSDTKLGFNEGTVYGTTTLLKLNFTNYIGVSKMDVVNLSLENCKAIYDETLYQCSNLTTVSLPVCEYVGSSAFYGCTSLTSINLPICTSIGSRAFYNCSSLSYVSLPICTSIGDSAFLRCINIQTMVLGVYSLSNEFSGRSLLKEVYLSNCSYVGKEAFYNCSLLSQISLPVCNYIGGYAFDGCSSLLQISLPKCSYITDAAFHSCTSLSQVSLPVCEYVGSSAFNNCKSLSYVSLPVCSYIGNLAFYLYNVSFSLILGYSGVVTAGGAQPINGGGLTKVYVPASLVDAYKSAPNWSYYSNQIFPITE